MSTKNKDEQGGHLKTLTHIADLLRNYPFLLVSVAGMAMLGGILVFDLEKLKEFKWLIVAMIILPILIQALFEHKKLNFTHRSETRAVSNPASTASEGERTPSRVSSKAVTSLALAGALVLTYGGLSDFEFDIEDIELQLGLLALSVVALALGISAWRDAARQRVTGKGLAVSANTLSSLLVISSLGWIVQPEEDGAWVAPAPIVTAPAKLNTPQAGTSLPLTRSPEPVDPEPSLTINLTGYWTDDEGAQYELLHNGDTLTFQQVDPQLGVVSVGEGTVQGEQIQLVYTTAMGTGGQASLQMSDDGRELAGVYLDFSTGVTLPIVLYR